ncbi:MAG TPA: carbon-nitrogen hydrolase family protein, partial [Pseudonocardiaceae bacterium]|nr:carbon-nitrogen hydrolase family protein [Pseudonocardiaceae bacterium]
MPWVTPVEPGRRSLPIHGPSPEQRHHQLNTLLRLAPTGTGDLLGHHRKVHQPLREDASYGAGNRFAAFDTPVGRLGMMICYDKAFPESARALALDGADVVLCLSAWPASATNRAPDLAEDRWKRRFDL